MMRALVCEESVTIPAWEPVSEIASWPMSWIAIAQSAQEIRSPVESSMSISRATGPVGDLLRLRDQLVGRLAAGREHGDDAATGFAGGDDPPAARLICSAPATEVPPNFITTMSEPSAVMNA